jgi:hypothetical protein
MRASVLFGAFFCVTLFVAMPAVPAVEYQTVREQQDVALSAARETLETEVPDTSFKEKGGTNVLAAFLNGDTAMLQSIIGGMEGALRLFIKLLLLPLKLVIHIMTLPVKWAACALFKALFFPLKLVIGTLARLFTVPLKLLSIPLRLALLPVRLMLLPFNLALKAMGLVIRIFTLPFRTLDLMLDLLFPFRHCECYGYHAGC